MTDKPTPTTDLLKRCAEIYEWRSTGVLSGEALRDYAKRKWPDLHDTLQMAEHETVTEALALLAKWGQPAQAAGPVAVVVPCHTPSGKRVALCSAKQDLPIGTKLYAAPQPSPTAPATQQAGDVVAYLDVGASGYLDLGAALSEDALQQLPKGRHALVIAGTYGIDGYVAAPQPSPTTKAAPQQEAQEPALFVSAKQLADLVDPSHATGGSYLPARKTRAGLFTQPLYTALQPAPAPLSDDTERLEWLLWKLPGDALRYVVGELADTSSGAEFRAAIDAAIAAQGGE